MNTTPKNISDEQEIDLSKISKKIGRVYQRFLYWIFNSMMFLKKHIITLSILFIIGIFLGYFLDKASTKYDHKIIVAPNFGSTDYLYSKIDLLNSKVKDRDTVFFKSIGIKESNKITEIKIEPIIDIYRFVNERPSTALNAQSTQNFELLKLLSESSDINKVIKEDLTGKNYTNHAIEFTTTKAFKRDQLITPILDYLNREKFYQDVQKEYIQNIKNKLSKNNEIIIQIDGILNAFSSAERNKKNDKLIYYNENMQLNEIINTKNSLNSEQGSLQLDLISYTRVVKDKSSVTNVKSTKGNKLKFIIPFLIVFLFIFSKMLVSFYRKNALKYKNT